MLDWAKENVGTKLAKKMNALALRRVYGYALTTLNNCRAEDERRQRLNNSYCKRSRGQ